MPRKKKTETEQKPTKLSKKKDSHPQHVHVKPDHPAMLDLESHLAGICEVLSRYLDPGARLSELHHRGEQCSTCRRPCATEAAGAELNAGDGPDLCWGDCG